jgi:hypothetical protein
MIAETELAKEHCLFVHFPRFPDFFVPLIILRKTKVFSAKFFVKDLSPYALIYVRVPVADGL